MHNQRRPIFLSYRFSSTSFLFVSFEHVLYVDRAISEDATCICASVNIINFIIIIYSPEGGNTASSMYAREYR